MTSDRISFQYRSRKDIYPITAIPDNTLAAAPTDLKVTKIKDERQFLHGMQSKPEQKYLVMHTVRLKAASGYRFRQN